MSKGGGEKGSGLNDKLLLNQEMGNSASMKGEKALSQDLSEFVTNVLLLSGNNRQHTGKTMLDRVLAYPLNANLFATTASFFTSYAMTYYSARTENEDIYNNSIDYSPIAGFVAGGLSLVYTYWRNSQLSKEAQENINARLQHKLDTDSPDKIVTYESLGFTKVAKDGVNYYIMPPYMLEAILRVVSSEHDVNKKLTITHLDVVNLFKKELNKYSRRPINTEQAIALGGIPSYFLPHLAQANSIITGIVPFSIGANMVAASKDKQELNISAKAREMVDDAKTALGDRVVSGKASSQERIRPEVAEIQQRGLQFIVLSENNLNMFVSNINDAFKESNKGSWCNRVSTASQDPSLNV